MATLNVAVGTDFGNLVDINATSVSGTSSARTFTGTGGDKFVVTGTGVSYGHDASGYWPELVNGNTYTFTWYIGGVKQWSVSGYIADASFNGGETGYNIGNNVPTLYGVSAEVAYALRGNDTVNGSTGNDILYGGFGNDTVNGNGGNDTVAGNKGNDILSGGAGSDKIFGGNGNDTLTGGTGKDGFFFRSTLGASTNVDKITDFSTVDDTIKLDHAIFTKLTATGTLNSAFFKANTAGTATDSNDYVVYETDTGKLFYDADGSGAGAKILFAILGTSTHPTITAADFGVM